MAFVDIARTARIAPSQAKQLRQAWQAYCSIWEMLDEGVDCSPEDRARIQRITDALARTLRDWLDRAS
ncbi:MAG TPA: hypothetical protein VFR39_02215 [Burkholderiales bacterium]|nr:hypothetical protein [Burkholderiales bacterium]